MAKSKVNKHKAAKKQKKGQRKSKKSFFVV